MSTQQPSQASTPAVLTPDRTHLLGAGIMVCILLLVMGAAPLQLFWLPLVPIIFIVWVLRSKTIVDAQGITIQYAFRAPVAIPWEQFQGIGFQRSRSFVATTDEKTYTLPGVSFNSLPKLEEASQGRIPDALTQAHKAADGKVLVVHKDGHQVLMSKEEFDAQHKD